MHDKKLVITGAAGLVGQNLVVLLKEMGYTNIVAIDKHPVNTEILRSLHPDVRVLCDDVSSPGRWQTEFAGADCLVQLHAQITGTSEDPFVRNNIEATKLVLGQAVADKIPYLVHISSSVVVSVAHDWYSETKRVQEQLVQECPIPHCILRPTLMFGWFDPKHFGWLSRFMKRCAVFPVPGDGRFLRQPLYARDFCRVIERCIATRPTGGVFDIVGSEEVYYVDIIRKIRDVTRARARIVPIPFNLFKVLLQVYAVFVKRPPFTAHQLKALAAGDYFTGVDMHKEFSIRPTPFEQALRETFCDSRFSSVVLEQTA